MEIILILILILLNGLFSMSEIALISARKFKLEKSVRQGKSGARKALSLSENPNNFLSTVQIGITLIGILIGIFSGKKLTDDLAGLLSTSDFLAPYSHSIAVITIVILVTYMSLIFGELVPKRIGLIFPEQIAAFTAHFMSMIATISKPFIWLLGKTSDFILNLFGIEDKTRRLISEEEIKAIIDESTSLGEIQEIENTLVKRVFELGDRKAGELMMHRTNVVWFDVDDSLDKIKETITKNPHTIYPVARKNIDNLLGTVSIKSLFIQNLDPSTFSLSRYLQKAVYVPENIPAYHVLDRFKAGKTHFAFVIDEYGSVQGIITLEDVLDAIVGKVMEADGEIMIRKRDDSSWLADGRLPYYDLLSHLDIEEKGEGEGFNTLAGLILHHLRHIPATGEKLRWKNYELEVVDMDARRIDKVLIKQL